MEQSFSILEVLKEAVVAMTWIEVLATITGLIYVILAVRENIWCWFFGIISSLLSIYLFYTGKLYAESFLYAYYVIAGFYGWYAWQQKRLEKNILPLEKEEQTQQLEIHTWNWQKHLLAIGLGIVLAFSLAKILAVYTDAAIPLLDAFTTIFSFIATYMVTRKVLENWLYWIIIDIVTTGMYFYKAYYLYALLMIIYTIIAVIGFIKWQTLMQKKDLGIKPRS